MQKHDSAHVYSKRAGDLDSNSLPGQADSTTSPSPEFVIDDDTPEGDLDVPIPYRPLRKCGAASAAPPSPLRVYVAAPRQEVARARKFARRLIEAGVAVTSTWLTNYIDGEEDPHPASEAARELDAEQRGELWGSSLLVALTSTHSGRQTYVEIGTAIELGLNVIWSAEHGGLALSAAAQRVTITETDAQALVVILAIRDSGELRAYGIFNAIFDEDL